MKLIMKPLKRSYFLIVLMVIVFSACHGQEARENVLKSSFSMDSTYGSPATKKDVTATPVNIILQSNDGGLTWQDISDRLPEQEYPESFFVGESDLYLRMNHAWYHSKCNLKTPVWEKASNGTVFFASDFGLFKSADGGEQWKQVNEGSGSKLVESEGVLMATGRKGIMRSTNDGDTWEWVISEGGVGIDIEKITGGFAAIVYNERTQSRTVHISADDGKTWKAVHDGLPPSKLISSIKQMGKYLFVGHPDGIFRSSDMGKTWKSVYPAVEEFRYTNASTIETTRKAQSDKVFVIYVSGNTLYAVARNVGC